MVDKRNCNEVVVLFSKEEVIYKDRPVLVLFPRRIVKGYYDDTEQCFVDENEVAYAHVLFGDVGVSFGKRISLSELLNKYPKCSLSEAKKRYLADIRNKLYFYDENAELYSTASIKEVSKDGEVISNFKDADIDYLVAQFNSYVETEHNEDNSQNVSFSVEVTSKNNTPEKVSQPQTFDIKSIYSDLIKRVIGQEDAHKRILRTIWKNFSNKDGRADNIFIKGSTGVGKTETFRVIAKHLGVPIIIKDCNDYTINGYKGSDVDDIIVDLVRAADGDLDKTSRGIVVLDEVDKLGGKEGDYEISTSGVQMALLKMIEDKDYNIKGKTLNTKGITFVCMGAFTNMDEVVIKNKVVGFERSDASDVKTSITDVTDLSDLEKYGMKPEFLGRFKNYVCMKTLELEDYIKIIKSEYSAFYEEIQFLKSNGVEIIFNDEKFIESLAKAAMKLNKGARGIEIVLANLFAEIETEIMLNDMSSGKIEITHETVANPKKYKLIKN